MADGATDWEDVFGDDLGLSKRFTAHSRSAGAQTHIEQLAASRAWRIPSSV